MSPTLYTVRDLDNLGEGCELDEGVLVPVIPGTFRHGLYCGKVDRKLGRFVEERGLGVVPPNDTRFWVLEGPDTVRGPDIAFLSNETLATRPSEGYWLASPDLAVEVLSEGNRPGQMQKKIGQYLEGGTKIVWLVNPERRHVVVYDREGGIRILSGDDVLDGADLLPGFGWRLSDLFDQ